MSDLTPNAIPSNPIQAESKPESLRSVLSFIGGRLRLMFLCLALLTSANAGAQYGGPAGNELPADTPVAASPAVLHGLLDLAVLNHPPMTLQQLQAFAEQVELNGTGHAVRCALPAIEDADEASPVFVLCGDGPLIRPATLETILETHGSAEASGTLATAVLDDPAGYGRIKRDAAGGFERIVEQKNATEEELAIREVNPSYYCFTLGALRWGLGEIRPNQTTGEEYVTDVPEPLAAPAFLSGWVTLPRAKAMRWSLPSRRTSQVSLVESALTTDAPTPWSPPEVL